MDHYLLGSIRSSRKPYTYLVYHTDRRPFPVYRPCLLGARVDRYCLRLNIMQDLPSRLCCEDM